MKRLLVGSKRCSGGADERGEPLEQREARGALPPADSSDSIDYVFCVHHERHFCSSSSDLRALSLEAFLDMRAAGVMRRHMDVDVDVDVDALSASLLFDSVAASSHAIVR